MGGSDGFASMRCAAGSGSSARARTRLDNQPASDPQHPAGSMEVAIAMGDDHQGAALAAQLGKDSVGIRISSERESVLVPIPGVDGSERDFLEPVQGWRRWQAVGTDKHLIDAS